MSRAWIKIDHIKTFTGDEDKDGIICQVKPYVHIIQHLKHLSFSKPTNDVDNVFPCVICYVRIEPF